MKGFFEYILKIGIVLLKILVVLFLIGLIVYFALTQFVDYRMKKNAEQEKVLQEQRAKEQAEYDKLHVGDKESQIYSDKEAEYGVCMNKAYKEYKTKYDEECNRKIIDGQCQISEQKLYEIHGIYEYDKKQCEKLKQ